MNSAAEAIRRVAQGMAPKAELSKAETDSIADVLDAALAWQRGELPLNDAMRLGCVEYNGKPSPQYTRFVATGSVEKSDPRWQALQAMLDVVTRKQHVVTKQGVFTPVQMTEHHGAIRYLQNHERAA